MHPIRKIMAVCIFLALLLAIFQLSGLREHFDLKYLQQKIIDNKVMILRQSRRLSVAGPSKGPDRDGHSDLHSAKLAEARTHLQPTHRSILYDSHL